MEYVKEKYNSSPEYLWSRFPEYAVFRHIDNVLAKNQVKGVHYYAESRTWNARRVEESDSPLNKENLSDCAVTICEMLDQLLITKIWKGKNYKDFFKRIASSA